MIKITFEVSEDFVRENAYSKNLLEKARKNDTPMAKVLLDLIGFGIFQKQLEKGKTEFVVSPEKLDENSMKVYENTIGDVCMLAAFSETDKPQDNEGDNNQ